MVISPQDPFQNRIQGTIIGYMIPILIDTQTEKIKGREKKINKDVLTRDTLEQKL